MKLNMTSARSGTTVKTIKGTKEPECESLGLDSDGNDSHSRRLDLNVSHRRNSHSPDSPRKNSLRRASQSSQSPAIQSPPTKRLRMPKALNSVNSNKFNSAEKDASGPSEVLMSDTSPSEMPTTMPIETPETSRSSSAKDVTMSGAMEDSRDWNGWCEIESDPAFFNAILRSLGTQDIKIQEVFSLDDELMEYIPKPVYGLIFLFQFREDDPSKQEASCPDHVWFANQITSNACASIALLNILMNIPHLRLGSHLEKLKKLTARLPPSLRGYEVCSNDFVRSAHNSFTRKMDMLNADLVLSNDARPKKSSGKKKAGKRRAKELSEDSDTPGYHFIVFVPIEGCVWKLDGLDAQPMNLGSYENNWLDVARPLINERMQQYEGDQIHFNLLSMCRSPLVSLRQELATNVQALNSIENQLSSLQVNWQEFIDNQAEEIIYGPNTVYGVTQQKLDEAQVSSEAITDLKSSVLITKLLESREGLVKAQGPLKASIMEEQISVADDDERAMTRRYDYTPFISKWVQLLAENLILEGLQEE